jgi:hypothetical protein
MFERLTPTMRRVLFEARQIALATACAQTTPQDFVTALRGVRAIPHDADARRILDAVITGPEELQQHHSTKVTSKLGGTFVAKGQPLPPRAKRP